ncbi:TolC family protein [Mucilaginibacter flavus]|uniref:TolC family protein n=1 Tax=Mucilaginibacter flavus TaxID=931504 RepID=UPI0025B33D08|nr:TolC family protein [Mucilaginibacter flavus]MDN3579974.1 TolC family protein [Mucilaginibacter flavus]
MKLFFSLILFAFIYTATRAQTNTLDHYIELAQNNSPLLKDLKNQIAAGRIDSLRLRAGLKPQVNLNSGGYYAPVISGFGYSGAITNVQTFNALLGVNKQIISKQYLNSQLNAINLQRDSIINSGAVSAQDLKKTVTGQYITAYGSLQQVNFNRDIVKLLTQEEALLKNLTRTNVYKQSEYLAFLVTLKQQQLQLTQAQLQYKNDYATLSYVVGIVDTATVDLGEPKLETAVRPDAANSIFFRQFKADSLRLINTRSLIDHSYRPKVNVFADGGYNTDFTGQAYKNFGTSFGFSISMPIYDGGQRSLQYKKLKLQEETRLNYKSFFNSQYLQQIAQLNQQINENNTLIGQIKEQVKYAESLIKVDTKLLQTGDVRMADLILAVNSYYSITNLLTQTTVAKLQLINQLNYWNK